MNQNTSESLLDLPDSPINFAYLLDPNQDTVFAEYLPVDDFFDQYVAQLDFSEVGSASAGMDKGARVEATARLSPLPSTDTSGATGSPVAFNSTVPLTSRRSDSADQTIFPDQFGGTPVSSFGEPAPFVSLQQSMPPQQQTETTARQLQPPLPFNSTGTVTSGTQGASIPLEVPQPASAAARGGYGGSSAIISGIPDQLPDRKVPKPGGKRKRVRDDRQQMLNKLAQVRYRERKRTNVATLEQEVSALEAQLAEMQAKQAEAADLAQRNRDIEAQLASLPSPSNGSGSIAAQLQASRDACASSPLPRDSQDDLDSLVKQWLAKSKEIKDLVALIGLGSSNKTTLGRFRNDVRRSVRKKISPKTRDLLAHVELRMATMVSDVTTLCMRVMRLQGAQVEQLMTADYEMVCSLRGWKDESKWLQAVKAVDFTPEQRIKVLAFRKEALECLYRLYNERRQLNDRVLAEVQPRLFAPASTSDQATNAAAQSLLQVMRCLSDNLAEEQRELAHQDWVLFRELLTPVQAGVLVAESFPDHCDAMALMNATAQLSK